MKKMPIEYLDTIEHNVDLAVGRKWDGFSEEIVIKDGHIRLFNRSGHEHTDKVPALTSKFVIFPDCTIQAEGVGSSGKVASAKSILGSGVARAIAIQEQHGPLKLICHNLVSLRGESLSLVRFGEKLHHLEDAVQSLRAQGLDMLSKENLIAENKYHYFKTIVEQGGEGVVVKNLKGYDSDFVKVKKFSTWDVVIMGFTEGKGKYSAVIGAIRYGAFKDGQLVEVGKCSGMSDQERRLFAVSPEAYIGKVIEVKGQEIDSRGGIRFPAFIRIRDDKLPEQCLIEDMV